MKLLDILLLAGICIWVAAAAAFHFRKKKRGGGCCGGDCSGCSGCAHSEKRETP
jgi:hypothetical protein